MKKQEVFLHVGYDGWLALDKIVAIQVPGSRPADRVIDFAQSTNQLITLTNGKKAKSLITMTTGHIALSGLVPSTLVKRLEKAKVPDKTKIKVKDK